MEMPRNKYKFHGQISHTIITRIAYVIVTVLIIYIVKIVPSEVAISTCTTSHSLIRKAVQRLLQSFQIRVLRLVPIIYRKCAKAKAWAKAVAIKDIWSRKITLITSEGWVSCIFLQSEFNNYWHGVIYYVNLQFACRRIQKTLVWEYWDCAIIVRRSHFVSEWRISRIWLDNWSDVNKNYTIFNLGKEKNNNWKSWFD